MSAAEQVPTIANIAFTAAHQLLIYKVALAYYAHIATQARVSTAEKALQNAKEVQIVGAWSGLHLTTGTVRLAIGSHQSVLTRYKTTPCRGTTALMSRPVFFLLPVHRSCVE